MKRILNSFVCYILVTAGAFADSYTNTLPSGSLSLIANQLDHGSNTFTELFPNTGGSLDGDEIQLYGCSNYITYYFVSGSPTGFLDGDFNPVAPGVLAPGQGALYYNSQGEDEIVVFSGAPHNPVLPAILPCGFGQTNLLSCPTKGPGTYENVTGYYEQEGAMVQQWNGESYDNYFFTGGAWSPNEPTLAVGESAYFIVPPSSQPVPSYTLNLLSGFNLIANQLNQGSNTLGEIMPVVPDGSVVYKYNNTSSNWTAASYSVAQGAWSPATLTLNPGEGAFFQSPTNFTLTFTGTPNVPALPITIPSESAYLLARQTNDVGNYENIVGAYPAEGAVVYQWDPIAQQYVTNEFLFGSWVPGPAEPALAIGGAAWICSAGAIPPPITVPPVIVGQPTNLTVLLGDPATFGVTVANTDSLAYQWLFNSFPIPGATNSTLTLSNVQTNNLGAYNVVVTNAYGLSTSTNAYLTNGALTVIVDTAGTSNCCWTFDLRQTNGAPGQITRIRATLGGANPGVITSAVIDISPPGLGFQETTLSSDVVLFSTTNANGLYDSSSLTVTICFSNIPTTGDFIVLDTIPGGNTITFPIVDYGGCASVVQISNAVPVTSGCCAAKSWNLQGPFPGRDYTFLDTNYACGIPITETLWPGARYASAMTYDEQTNLYYTVPSLLLFGGADSNGLPLSDTWLWNGQWQNLGCGPTIPARSGHAMAYYPVGNYTLLFGGLGASGYLGDTWTWNLTVTQAWSPASLVSGAPNPTPRFGHAMVFDPTTQEIILFGGLDGSGFCNDTWAWDGFSWNRLPISGPSARQGHAMVYDPNFNGIILVGGTDTNGVEGDMWKLVFTNSAYAWYSVAASGVTPRTGHAMAYDPVCEQIEVFGGFDNNGNPLGDIWEYNDATETWLHALNLGTPPAPRGAVAGSYYPPVQGLAIFGGDTIATSSTTNFSENFSWAPTNDFSEFYYNPNPVNNGVNSNYTPCPSVVTGPLWQRTLLTAAFSWAYPGGWFTKDHGEHSFTYASCVGTDVTNTYTQSGYPDPYNRKITYYQSEANSHCNNTFASPQFDCNGFSFQQSVNYAKCGWSFESVQLYSDYAMNGDFCPDLNLNLSFYDNPARATEPHVGTVYADGSTAPFANSVFPPPCAGVSSYNQFLQYSDPGDPPKGSWIISNDLGSPAKVDLQWHIADVGVGTAIGELNPCSTESGGPVCQLAYFEFDQVSGTELRFRARVAGGSLLDVPTLQQEGSLRQFQFFIDADNNTNTGDQCCIDRGADYYVQVTQSVYVDGNGDGQIANSATIYKWNPCVFNTNDCGVVGEWVPEPSGSTEVYNLTVRGTQILATVPLSAVGNPLGAYSAWPVLSATNSPNGCAANALPETPCNCRMVLTRVADTNCPYVVGVDTTQVSTSLSSPIVVTFNKAMSTINPSDITMSPSQALAPFLVYPSDNTLHIRPASGMWNPGCYTVTLQTTIMDASSNYLCSPVTFNFCVPDTTFFVCDVDDTPKTNFNQGDNIYVHGIGFSPSSPVTLYLVTTEDVLNSGSVLADWTTVGAKKVTTDSSGRLPLVTLVGQATDPGEYKVVADVNNDGIYETNIDRVTDLCGNGLLYGLPCTNLITNAVAAWWPFSEVSAAGPVNEFVDANNGIVIGTNTTLIPGEIGQGRTFNTGLPLAPTPTYVIVSNSLDFSGSLSFGSDGFSIELWLKTTETGEAPLVDKRQFSGGVFSGYYFYLSNGVPMLQLGDGNNVWAFTCSAPGAATGNWTHVAVTIDQTLFAVTDYVNGVGYPATPSAVYNAPIVTDNPANLWMAASQAAPGPATYFVGDMDELTLYDATLTAAQVEYIYANGKCAPPLPVTNSVTPATNFIGNYTRFTAPFLATNLSPAYQWFTNGIPVLNNPPYIFGGQTSVLTMLASSVLQSGTISYSVSGIFGTVYSSNAPFTILPITPATTIVGFNSAWKYLANGSNPATNWNQIGFNDGSWSAGLGLFGSAPTNVWPYPFQTAIEPPSLGGPITTYYRTLFQWDGSTNDVNLVSTNFIQDGAVFYINGAEAGRLRVPADQNYLTLASPQTNPGQPETVAFPVGSLLPGTNLLAVEVHQSSGSATQDVFGLGLTANVSIGFIPMLTITNSGRNTVVSWSGPGTLQSTPNLTVPWSNVPASSPYSTPVTNGIRFYRLRVP